MNKNANGDYQRAIQYIARTEDFQKAVTNQGHLRVIAVYPDGQCEFTQLSGYITETRLVNASCFEVQIDGTKLGHFVKVIVL